MTKICLLEYMNIVDEKGQPFGHGLKVLSEAREICEEMGWEYQTAASKEYLSYLSNHSRPLNRAECEPGQQDVNDKKRMEDIEQDDYIRLRYSIKMTSSSRLDTIKKIINIRTALTKTDADIVWITNCNWSVLLAIGLLNKRKKIALTTYMNLFDKVNKTVNDTNLFKKIIKKMHKNLLLRGYSKIDLLIKTYRDDTSRDSAANLRAKPDIPSVYMPDYLYSDRYQKYCCNNKIKRILFLGTKNSQKETGKLIQMISLEIANGKLKEFELVVAGEFFSESERESVQRIANNSVNNGRIKVIDRYLEDDDFYSLLGESAYVVAPYVISRYGYNRTSGIVREAAYLGAKVISPGIVFKNTGIDGLGYEKIEEIPGLICTNEADKDSTTQGSDRDSKFDECRIEQVAYRLKKTFERCLSERS